jgi:hypothetical protein
MVNSVVIDVGEMPVRVNATDAVFTELLQRRYAGFVNPAATPAFEFDVSIVSPHVPGADKDVSVHAEAGRWLLERGDFRAEWDERARRGWITQTVNPYSIDSVLRIVHSLLLSRQGGFLLHAASAVRDGHAFVFTGPSGAGKTTMARLAPPDVRLLTDEISYVRQVGQEYIAFGTPFAGELGTPGEKISAPVSAVYRLDQAADNKIERLGASDAVRTLMRNILFFAEDTELTSRLLETACQLAHTVPVYRLAFAPDTRVWDLIR